MPADDGSGHVHRGRRPKASNEGNRGKGTYERAARPTGMWCRTLPASTIATGNSRAEALSLSWVPNEVLAQPLRAGMDLEYMGENGFLANCDSKGLRAPLRILGRLQVVGQKVIDTLRQREASG
jgi:hypothetical protein